MTAKKSSGNLLFWKICGVFTALLVLMGITYVIMASHISRRYFYEVNQQLYGDIAAHLAASTKPLKNGRPDTLVTHDIIHSIMVINPAVEVYLLDKQGRIIDFVVPDKSVKKYTVDLGAVHRYIREKGRRYIAGDNPKDPSVPSIFSAAPIYENGQLGGYVYAVLASEKQAGIVAALNKNLFFSLGSAIFFGTLITVLLVGTITYFLITGSISKAAAVVKRFKEGDYSARITGQGTGNLGVLTAAFNEMADTIVSNMEKLAATDRLRQELIANVSHDLRTPLAIMQGYIETLMIKQEQVKAPDQSRYLGIIFDSSRNLSRLVEQLFEYSKLEANQTEPQKEVVAFRELVNDILIKYQLLAKEKGITLTMDASARVPHVFADIALMERVVQNLLDNSLKFTEPGGEIMVMLRARGQGVEVSVTDNGVGIPASRQSYIFERYKQLPENGGQGKGMGLGLAIVKKILDLHETKIHIKSAPDEGTTFWFLLPAFEGAAKAQPV